MAALRNRKMGSILNLVFDKWDDNGKPIPNLIFLNEKLNCEAIPNIEVGAPMHFFTNLGKDLVDNNYEKNYCKLSDISPNENYYYIVVHYCSYNNLFNENEWQLSEEVEYCVRNKNFKVIQKFLVAFLKQLRQVAPHFTDWWFNSQSHQFKIPQ